MSLSWSARLRLHLELWLAARSLPLLAHARSLEQTLRLGEAEPYPPYRGLTPDYLEGKIRRMVRGPFFMRNRRCLRIGLLGYRFLRKAGHAPELHFGLDPASVVTSKIEAHCWVCLDGVPVIGEPLPGMMTIFVHASQPDAKGT